MKITIIVTYFGQLPQIFPLFLKSCEFNKDFNWLILTDSKKKYKHSKNVSFVKIDFQQLRHIIQSKFNYKISLKKPYKLCDFKVSWGYIFAKELRDSEWWGFSDVDLVYGNLSKFLNKDLLNNYDKIFTTGHLCLFRNTKKVNECFMGKYRGINYAKRVFTSPEVFGFDEMVINGLFEQQGFSIYKIDLSCNPSVYYYKYRLVKRNYNLKRYITEDYTPSLYVWNDGRVERYFFSEDDGRYTKNDFAYMHFQQRPLYIKGSVKECNKFIFYPSYILGVQNLSRKELWDKRKEKFLHFNFKLFLHFSSNRYRYRIKRKLSFMFHGMFTRGKF